MKETRAVWFPGAGRAPPLHPCPLGGPLKPGRAIAQEYRGSGKGCECVCVCVCVCQKEGKVKQFPIQYV